MNGEIIKLKYLAEEIQAEISNKMVQIGTTIKMACVMVGDDQASLSYINGIKKNSEKLGIITDIINLPSDITELELVAQIIQLDKDDSYSGIIIQMPLPKHINKNEIASIIDFRKDIDGVSPYNQGLLFSGRSFMIPATAWAVDIALVRLARERNISLAGKKALILGRSVTVGKPAFHLLLQRDITPTIAHTKSLNVEELAQDADIIVACCGVAEMVNDTWIKPGAIILDVGINSKFNAEGKSVMCGDVHTQFTADAGAIVTAVPGGIGTLTSSLLYANCLKGYFLIHKNESIVFDFEV